MYFFLKLNIAEVKGLPALQPVFLTHSQKTYLKRPIYGQFNCAVCLNTKLSATESFPLVFLPILSVFSVSVSKFWFISDETFEESFVEI